MEKYPKGWFDISPETYSDLGAMLYLAGLTKPHRHRTLAQSLYSLETPVRLKQYRIFRQNGYPRGYVTFAGLSPEAEYRLAVEGKHLRNADFTSGHSFWILDLVAPFGQTRQIVDILKREIPQKRVRTNRMDSDLSLPRVVEWTRDDGGEVHMRIMRQKTFVEALRAEGL